MKSFFKTFLASFLGSALLLLVIIIFLITSLVSSIMSSADTTVEVKPQTVLYMNLDYEIPDRTNTNDLGLTFSGLDFSFTDVDMAGMNDIINNIKAAAIDPNIAGIFLEMSVIGTSTANIEEIRNHLIEFKKSGKFILSYAEAYSQSAYYLASVSDKIYMLPVVKHCKLKSLPVHFNLMSMKGSRLTVPCKTDTGSILLRGIKPF